jgi:hypothetical protein
VLTIFFHLKTFNNAPVKQGRSIGFDSLNGVLLDQNIHAFFHRVWGSKQPVTIDLFIKFLESLLKDKNLMNRVQIIQ